MSKAFFSFHFDNDVFRASMVRNMGVVEGEQPVSDQSWEAIKRGGDLAIERWIKDQINSCDVVIILVGAKTASRPWVNYEIRHAWDNYKPLFGIRIHGLKDVSETTSTAGLNPFEAINLQDGSKISTFVPLHLLSGGTSKEIYATIKTSMPNWIDAAPSRKK